MFSFLVVLGLIFIIWGVYLDKNEFISSLFVNINKSNDTDKLDKILHRIEHLENELNRKNIILEEEDISFSEILEIANIEIDDIDEEKFDVDAKTLEAFKTISQYENGKYTLVQICKILNMNKGEVLLLRNLYKKYQE